MDTLAFVVLTLLFMAVFAAELYVGGIRVRQERSREARRQ
jgi:hypothetical protein